MFGDLSRSARLVALLLFAGLLVGRAAFGTQQYALTNYTNADGLPQAQVLSVFQDSRGYMWFGTYGGVARYDGSEYRTLTAADGLVGNVVYAIAESRGGRMFFGTGEGITVLDDGNLTELKAPDGRSIREVRRIFTDTRRGRWIATTHGLYRERGGIVERFTEADGLPSDSTFVVTRDAGGYLWVGTERGLARLSGDRFAPVSDGLPADSAVHVIVARGSELWIGTDEGIYQRIGERFERIEPPDPSRRHLANVVDATVDPAGKIWIATLGGIVTLDHGDRQLVAGKGALENGNIKALLADREGNLWLGSDDGVSKLVPGPFIGFSDRDGLPHAFVRGLAEDDMGRIWIATRGGVGVMEPDQRIWSIGAQEGLTEPRVYAVAPLGGDEALFGTPTGLFHYRDGVAVRLTTANGLPSDSVRALYRLGGDRVWIGTNSGLATWDAGRIEAVPAQPDIGPLDILALERDPSGALWISTIDGGLVVYTGSRFERRAESLNLRDVELWSLAADWDGGMWVGTNGRGAYRINGGQVLHLSTAEGLSNDFVWQVLSDRGGRVWFYTNRGLDRWDGTSIRHYDLADGLLDLEGSANAILQDRKSNLWFGTGRGLAKYVPEQERREEIAPLVQIQRVAADGKPKTLSASRVVEFDHDDSTITLHYAGLSFHDERSVRYRYRLLGHNEQWSLPTPERRVSYAGLSHGHYTFEVIASNGRGIWSEAPASVTFVVRPAWFETPWMRAAFAVLIILAFLGAYFHNRRRERQEKAKLERMVEVRTEQLARSEERMRNALRDSPTFVFNQDRELRYTWVHNPIMGLEPDQILGAHDSELLEPEAALALTEVKQQVLHSGEGMRQEVSLCRAGEQCSLDVSIEPSWEDGAVVGITGAAWDVTTQRELEAQLRHAQKMEVVGRLAGGMAHDFNNLLTGITGYAELGKARLPIDSPVADDFQQVLKCSHRAADLIQQLLAFSRQQPLEPVATDSAELVEGVTKLLRRLIGEDIALTVTTHPRSHAALMDRSQIEQVLVNLAVNSRDAMPNGGELHISTSNVAVDEALAADYQGLVPGNYVKIVVADTGIGMSPETIERAFEPFYTTKEVGKGTGLGLATTYGIVKQHNGYVYVESELGKGTAFEIWLPAMTERVDQEDEGPVEEQLAGGNETILLVEDEDTVREVTKRWLEQIGYTVYPASGPQQAVEIFRRHECEIDLLLTDVVMPVMNGPELYRNLASFGTVPRVLYMTGYLDCAGNDRTIAGPDAVFLQKPFELNGLAESVRSALGDRAAA